MAYVTHSWLQHQQWAHQQGVCQTGHRTQSTCNKDQHDELVAHGAPQDGSTFGLRPRAPRPMPAASSHPCYVAAGSSPHQLHHPYAANDASCTLSLDALHGAAVQTSASSAHPACSSRTRTTGKQNDDALLRTVPSASFLLTITGKQQ